MDSRVCAVAVITIVGCARSMDVDAETLRIQQKLIEHAIQGQESFLRGEFKNKSYFIRGVPPEFQYCVGVDGVSPTPDPDRRLLERLEGFPSQPDSGVFRSRVVPWSLCPTDPNSGLWSKPVAPVRVHILSLMLEGESAKATMAVEGHARDYELQLHDGDWGITSSQLREILDGAPGAPPDLDDPRYYPAGWPDRGPELRAITDRLATDDGFGKPLPGGQQRAVAALLSEHADEIARCARRLAAERYEVPSRASITLDFWMGQDGTTAGVGARSTLDERVTLQQCLLPRMQSWKFPRRRKDAHVVAVTDYEVLPGPTQVTAPEGQTSER